MLSFLTALQGLEMRAQSSVEYLSFVGLIILLVVVVMMQGLTESEVNIAISVSRLAAMDFVKNESTLFFTSIDYEQKDNIITIYPNIYPSPLSQEKKKMLTYEILKELAKVFNKKYVVKIDENCVPTQNHVYCIGYRQ